MYPNLPVKGDKGRLSPPQNVPRKNSVQNSVQGGNPPAEQKSQLSDKAVNFPPYPVPFGPKPAKLICPSCSKRIETTIKHEPTKLTNLNAILCCGLCCCCIPYIMDSCQNANHYCSNCEAYIGSYTNI